MTLFIFLFTVSVAVACSNNDDENESQTNDVEETEENDNNTNNEEEKGSESTNNDDGNEEENQANDEENKDTDQTENDDSNQSDESASESNDDQGLPDPIEINDRVQTDTGLVFEMEKITFEDDHIAVHFNADNQSPYRKYMASKGAAGNENLGGITLQDDTGFDYRYTAEFDGARIELKEQEQVDGIARFIGRIEDDAETLTLIFNPQSDDESDSAPRFAYEDLEIEW